MRKFALGVAIGLAAMAFGGGLVALQRWWEAASPVVAAAVAAAVPAQADPAPADRAPAPSPAPAPAKTASALPDLPTVEVESHPVHAVPDELSPSPPVTIFDRRGREIRTAETPPPKRPALAPAAAFAPASGPAVVTGPTTLSVGGRPLRLFGVVAPEPRDRCGLGPGDNRSCGEVARDALAQRLKKSPDINCHVPPGQPGEPGAICVDATGTDLAGFLVAEGYALADTKRSYQYFGAEGVARTYREGLWRYR